MNVFALGFFDNSQASESTSAALQDLAIDNKPANLKWVYSDFVEGEYTGYYGTAQENGVSQFPTIVILGEYEEQTATSDAKYVELSRLHGEKTTAQIRAEVLKYANSSAPPNVEEGGGSIATESPQGEGIVITKSKCPKWMPRLICNKFGHREYKGLKFGLGIIVVILLLFVMYKTLK